MDQVIDRDDGAVVAFEVKSGDHVDGSALGAMRKLRQRLGASFIAGVAFHLGSRGYRVDDRLHVLPVDRLWADQT